MNKNIIIKKDQNRVIPVIWDGKEDNLNYTIKLKGEGADLTLLMLILANKNRGLTVRTNIIHEVPNTKSRVIIKGALSGAAHVDFEGIVKVVPGAKNTNAWLAAHLLLLSRQAGGRAVPNMEIAENEVKAGHAATVGKINEIELFYLMSRGLSKEAATRLIVQGFLESIVSEFPLNEAERVRKKLKWT
jgi:Fe-S cluster assembly protein SufD